MSSPPAYAILFTASERAGLVDSRPDAAPLGPRGVAGRTRASPIGPSTGPAGGCRGISVAKETE